MYYWLSVSSIFLICLSLERINLCESYYPFIFNFDCGVCNFGNNNLFELYFPTEGLLYL
jgi:hypothetical protein